MKKKCRYETVWRNCGYGEGFGSEGLWERQLRNCRYGEGFGSISENARMQEFSETLSITINGPIQTLC